jgi:RHS repeat-associated protein
VPKGYLRVLVFNQDSVLVDQRTVQLSQAALNNYEVLQTGYLPIGQDGYVSVYVGNESAVDVLFDDVQVEYRQGLLVQETHYDPAGLELAGLAPPSPGIRGLNNYRFNGKEFQADLGLSWNHQDWRFFDPQLLRWHTGDPELENGQESWTPYSFGYDNAVRYADSNGRAPGDGDPPATISQAPFYAFWPGAGNPVVRGVVGFAYDIVAGPVEAVANAGVSLVHGDPLPAFMLTNPVGQAYSVTSSFAQGARTYLDPTTPGSKRAEMATKAVLAIGAAALGSRRTGNSQILSREARLEKFKAKLLKAPEVSSPKAAIRLINKTLNKVENKHADPNDRMYGYLDDKFITYHEDGSVTAKSRGHQANISPDGGFTITHRKGGAIFVDKRKK